jgi:hypothetical protein
MQGKFRLAHHVVCRQTGAELRMLFDRDKGVMYELNESASAVVGCLSEGPAGVDDLVVALIDEFEAPTGEIKTDVEGLLADFVGAGLVIEE